MIVRKSAAEIERMRTAGRIVAEVLETVRESIVPGKTTTQDLNDIAEALCRERGGVPTFLGYRDFPASACISVNEAVVHGIPDGRVLQSGDIVSLVCEGDKEALTVANDGSLNGPPDGMLAHLTKTK